jgi:hypothetical protein
MASAPIDRSTQPSCTLRAPGREINCNIAETVWPGHSEGIQRYFSAPLTDHDVTVLKRVLAKLIKTNVPLLDQAAQRGGDGIGTVSVAANLSKP